MVINRSVQYVGQWNQVPKIGKQQVLTGQLTCVKRKVGAGSLDCFRRSHNERFGRPCCCGLALDSAEPFSAESLRSFSWRYSTRGRRIKLSSCIPKTKIDRIHSTAGPLQFSAPREFYFELVNHLFEK